MNKTPNTEQNRSSAPADEWRELLETPEVMSSSGSPNSRNIPTPANYPWDEESSSVPSSSSSSSQKLILILEEDGNTVVADESGTKYDWAWQIHDENGGQSSSGNEGSHTARYVGQHVATMPGISNREGAFAGQEVTIAFASRDENGVWKPNGWSVTAKKYEVLGVNDKDLQGLNDYKKIPPQAKPITRESILGMTTFLASKLGGAKDPGYDHWYMIINE